MTNSTTRLDSVMGDITVIRGLVYDMPFTNKGGQLVRWRKGVLSQLDQAFAKLAASSPVSEGEKL